MSEELAALRAENAKLKEALLAARPDAAKALSPAPVPQINTDQPPLHRLSSRAAGTPSGSASHRQRSQSPNRSPYDLSHRKPSAALIAGCTGPDCPPELTRMSSRENSAATVLPAAAGAATGGSAPSARPLGAVRAPTAAPAASLAARKAPESVAEGPEGKQSAVTAAAAAAAAGAAGTSADGKAPVRSVTLVVVGASGDLAFKKTFPAIFSLWRQGLLPRDVDVVGYARSALTRAAFTTKISSKFDLSRSSEAEKQAFLERCSYTHGAYDSDESFVALHEYLLGVEAKHEGSEGADRVFYFAIPPDVFVTVAQGLNE